MKTISETPLSSQFSPRFQRFGPGLGGLGPGRRLGPSPGPGPAAPGGAAAPGESAAGQPAELSAGGPGTSQAGKNHGKMMGKWWFWCRCSWWENVETCEKTVEKTWGLKIELKIVKDEIRMLPWFSHDSTWFSFWIYGILRIPSGNLAVCYGQWRVCRWFSYWKLLFYGFSIAMLLCSLELRIHSTESGWYMIYDDIYTDGWYVTHINAISNRLIHLAIWGYFAVFRVWGVLVAHRFNRQAEEMRSS